MHIFRGIDSVKGLHSTVVTVGSFDGVHLGHKAILDCLKRTAKAYKSSSVVVTFDSHPRIALGRSDGLKLLTSEEEKLELLARYGVDYAVVLPFDESLRALTAGEFTKRVLVDALGARAIVVGYDHKLGSDRGGYDELSATLPIDVIRVDELFVDGHRVSSTEIRKLLSEGNQDGAEKLLGHKLGGI